MMEKQGRTKENLEEIAVFGRVFQLIVVAAAAGFVNVFWVSKKCCWLEASCRENRHLR